MEVRSVLDGVAEFIADAVDHLALSLGKEHPTVVEGRRILASLRTVPDGAVVITEETLAAALQRAWPYRRNTPAGMGLSAALIIAALRRGS